VQSVVLAHRESEVRQGRLDSPETSDQQANKDHQDLVDQTVLMDQLGLGVTPAVLGRGENEAIQVKLACLD